MLLLDYKSMPNMTHFSEMTPAVFGVKPTHIKSRSKD